MINLYQLCAIIAAFGDLPIGRLFPERRRKLLS